jgi:hypothetical protein
MQINDLVEGSMLGLTRLTLNERNEKMLIESLKIEMIMYLTSPNLILQFL